jgi:hypothetical protein
MTTTLSDLNPETIKHLFILPCYYNSANPVIFNAVKSIRQFHPYSPIVVVDSGSEDKSYFEILRTYDVIIEDIENVNYDTGAFWYVYKKYKHINFFYFLHDSIEVYDNLFDLLYYDITSIRYFDSGNFIGGQYVLQKKIDGMKKYISHKLGLMKWEKDMIGFDNQLQKDWVKNQLTSTKYWIPNYFVALFGPMMCINRSVLDKLEKGGLAKVLPSNKIEQMGMERIFGIALAQEGYNIINQSLQGNHLKGNLNKSRFNKYILNRP